MNYEIKVVLIKFFVTRINTAGLLTSLRCSVIAYGSAESRTNRPPIGRSAGEICSPPSIKEGEQPEAGQESSTDSAAPPPWHRRQVGKG
jgi:hypothetical protein